MSTVSTYLNFMGTTEEAFNFYKEVFGTEFISITRMNDMPRPDSAPTLSEHEQNLIMNIQLPITSGHILMGTDMIASMGHSVRVGNNTTIAIDFDTLEEAERVYSMLSTNSTESSGPLAPMPWGAMWGSCLDQYDIRWMISHSIN